MRPDKDARDAIPGWLYPDSDGTAGGCKDGAYSLGRYLYVIGSNFVTNQGTLRAAALTYITVLSLVPFLALAFSVLKGLGVQNTLEPFLLEIAGESDEIVSRIIGYVNNTSFKSLGTIGLLTLVFTAVSLLESIEEAFNATWRVVETRSFRRRFSDYLSVIVVGPILILVATSITSGLQSQWFVQWLIQQTYIGDAIHMLLRLVPYLSIWIAIVFLYIFIPNTRVRFTSALLGGLLAGTAWEIAQWGYFHFQVGVANYNAIYGTLAAVPVFLVWIYTSWIIVLFGLEIVYVHQFRQQGFKKLLARHSVRSDECPKREETDSPLANRSALSYTSRHVHARRHIRKNRIRKTHRRRRSPDTL